jgi:hypothetical protein
MSTLSSLLPLPAAAPASLLPALLPLLLPEPAAVGFLREAFSEATAAALSAASEDFLLLLLLLLEAPLMGSALRWGVPGAGEGGGVALAPPLLLLAGLSLLLLLLLLLLGDSLSSGWTGVSLLAAAGSSRLGREVDRDVWRVSL